MKYASNPFAAVRAHAKELVEQMTLEEKAALCGGKTSGTPMEWNGWV